MKSKKIVVISIIIAVLAVAVAAVLIFKSKTSADYSSAASLYVPEEPGIAVEAVTAEFGKVIPQINASGLIRGKNEAVIISETRGVIDRVYAEIGSFIDKGEPILSVDSNVAKLSMQQAEQQFRSAEIDYKSVKRAYDGGSASEAELLRVQGQLAGAEASYEDSLNRYENSVVKAPFSGFLADLESNLGIGNYINEGVRIGRVIDLSGIRIDLFLGDAEIRRIKKDSPASIKTGNKILEGSVKAIALSSDNSTGSFRVIVEAENSYGSEIRSGFSADVSISDDTNDSVIVIPASSVFDIGGEKYVYIIVDNKAGLRKVEPGSVSGNRMEIITGLENGEKVIVSGFKSLSDGAEVIPRFADTTGGGE